MMRGGVERMRCRARPSSGTVGGVPVEQLAARRTPLRNEITFVHDIGRECRGWSCAR